MRVIDRAIQVHGAAGVSDDYPLAEYYSRARTVFPCFSPHLHGLVALPTSRTAE